MSLSARQVRRRQPAPADVASLPGDETNDAHDPMEKMNRSTYERNQRFNEAVIYPAAKAYINTVPEPVRNSVENFTRQSLRADDFRQ